jgi:hypothetical protein
VDFLFIYYEGVAFQRSGESGFLFVSLLLVLPFLLMAAIMISMIVQEGSEKVIYFLLYSVTVMEAMSKMLDKAVGGGFLSGFSMGTEASGFVMVSHLLFADDKLIFCDADSNQVLLLRCLLTWFEAVSGLKVNLAKSELVPVGDVPHIVDLAVILGCKTTSLQMKY